MPINDIMKMTLSGTTVALGNPSMADFTTGFKDVTGAAATVTIKSNRTFSVGVVGATSTFGYSGTGTNPSKPRSDLKWATTQGGLATATHDMSTAGTLFTQGPTASAAQSIFFRTTWVFNRDVPGTYSLSVSFTLSAP
jgi:hypothetical protein